MAEAKPRRSGYGLTWTVSLNLLRGRLSDWLMMHELYKIVNVAEPTASCAGLFLPLPAPAPFP